MSDAPPTNRSMMRLAATMLVLREHGSTIEVLMTRRHAALAFMGDMWVFPGGTLANADRSHAALALAVHADRWTRELHDHTGAALPRETTLALTLAACRETFEETGILIARRSEGTACDADQLARLQAERAAMTGDPESFFASMTHERLCLPVSELVHWAHWITPSSRPRRFDTHFFLAAAPDSHTITADTTETTECCWMAPAQLLAAAQRREMKIAQPTRYNLADLQRSIEAHGTLANLLRAEASRPIEPVLPKLIEEQDRTLVVMPWDPSYSSLPGEGMRMREPGWLASLPSRSGLD